MTTEDATPEPPLHEPTYPVSAGAEALRKSRRWYQQQLKAGRLPGHKAGRTWFLTAADIAAAIELTSKPATDTPPPGRRRTSRRRHPIPPQHDRKPNPSPDTNEPPNSAR